MAEGMIRGRKSERRRQGARACVLWHDTCSFAGRLFKRTATRLNGEFASLHFAHRFGDGNQVVDHRPHAGRIAAYTLCLLFPVHGYAEELPDPTRPPTSITLPAPIAGSPPAGLQSIIISKSRKAAIIDGETVELGGKHGDATLIEVGENGVVLQGAQGRQVLTLFPDVKIMQRDIQAMPNSSVKEGGVARTTKLKARKERK